jgi:hypothetical protein
VFELGMDSRELGRQVVVQCLKRCRVEVPSVFAGDGRNTDRAREAFGGICGDDGLGRGRDGRQLRADLQRAHHDDSGQKREGEGKQQKELLHRALSTRLLACLLPTDCMNGRNR